MFKKLLFCLGLLFSLSTQASNGSIHSGKIITDTLSALPECLHYQIQPHVCIWVNEWGKVNTTPVLSHYLPDIVVTVFRKPGKNPWIEMNKTVDTFSKPVQQRLVKTLTGFDSGSGSHSLLDVNEQAVIFKEADVTGNPALLMIPNHGLLPSTATPFKPYFDSMADSLLWRGLPPAALPEENMALGLNLTHHIGTGLTNWGGLYPHEGKIISENDAKSSAVIAARAADMLTKSILLGHVHQTLATRCGKHCSAAPIRENSKETYFQMIYPITQHHCHVLGESDSYSSDMLNPDGAYAWVIWRHYKGCADGDGTYIGRT